MTDNNICRKISESCSLSEGDHVLEIGCGRGALTRHLLQKGISLYGVEFDRDLYRELRDEFGSNPLFTLFESDILHFDFSQIPSAGNKIMVVGNLPYHISSPILFRLIEERHRIKTATIMLQKEVAERIVSGPGTKEYGILSVFCQYFAECTILFHIPPTAFFPKPKVDSSILRLAFRETVLPVGDFETFRQIVRKSFNQRRKMLRNSLSHWVDNKTIDFDLQKRPEELSVQDFIRLSNLITT